MTLRLSLPQATEYVPPLFMPGALMTCLFDPLSDFLFESLDGPGSARGRTLRVVQLGRGANLDFEWA